MSISLGNGEVVKIYKGNSSYKVMTAVIDLSDSNPATCVSYADDATNMTAGSSAWDEFFGHYPCILNNGVELGKLNPSNFNLYENGNSAPVTKLGNDVMIAFPRLGVRITTENNKITVSMTNAPNNADFKYYAHSRGDVSTDVFYLGAYKGYVSGDKLYSTSGQSPTTNQTIGTFRTQAHNRGSGYEQSGFYQVLFRQCMYVLKYKNLNSQAVIGQGFTGGSAKHNTGVTNTKGMDYGSTTSSTEPVKLFGIEDFYGNVYEWVDGLATDSSRNIFTNTTNFQDDGKGTGYMSNSSGLSSNIIGYMSKPQGTTEKGFILKEANGSATTYFSDNNSLYVSCAAACGGHWYSGSADGVFQLGVNYSASASYSVISARLMYLPTVGRIGNDKEGEIQKVYLGSQLIYPIPVEPITLYDVGNEYTDITGGFRGSACAYTGTHTGTPSLRNFNKLSKSIYFQYNFGAAVITTNKINISKYKTLYGLVRCSSSIYNGGIALFDDSGSMVDIIKDSAGNRVFANAGSEYSPQQTSLDISAIKGSYYIGCWGAYVNSATSTIYFSKLWLE